MSENPFLKRFEEIEKHTGAEVSNAYIQKTMLGFEDHGIFTFYLHLGGPGWGQAFGGIGCQVYRKTLGFAIGHAFGTQMLMCVLNTLQVGEWSQLVGKPVRLYHDNGHAYAIGNFVEDIWLVPQVVQDELRRLMEEKS